MILDAATEQPWEGGASFSLRHRLFRILFAVCWTLSCAWTPVPLHGWRRRVLKLFGARLADTAIVYPSVKIWYPPNLGMGAHACLGPRADVYCIAKVVLGDHAIISQGAHLCTGTHDIEDPNFQLIARPIFIGARAWVASEAFVGPGVGVGEGAVLGARSVAFAELQPWTVYAGNPAVAIKSRRIRFSTG